MQEQLRYEASHDKLTGLANREQMVNRLEEVIQRYQSNPERKFAVLFLDLNRFKAVNDTFGHTVGDQLLIVVAQQLKNCLREDDLVARFGGDEKACIPLTRVQSHNRKGFQPFFPLKFLESNE